MCKAILFDLDLTLVDSSRAIVKAIKHTLDSKGYYKREDVGQLVGKTPIEDHFRSLIPSLSDEQIWECVESYRRHYQAHHLKDTTIYPQVGGTLKHLKNQGFKLGIVTGKYRKLALEVLNHFHLISLFDVVVTSYEVKSHKPSPKVVLEAARRLGIKASECIVVGDSPTDIESGKRAGALTIAISRGKSSLNRLEKARPNLIIENISELPDAVRSLF